MDGLLAIAFWAFCELLAWPLRLLLVAAPGRALPPDVARVLSRVAGPLLVTLPLWPLAYLGRGPLTAPWLWLALVATGAGLCLRRSGRGLRPTLLGQAPGAERETRRGFWALELLSLGLFLGFVCFRRLVPEMTSEIGASAAEKFMNAALWWSNWQARRLPAEDYWFAGHAIQYYDWGHFHWALLARMGVIFRPEVAINLALARVTLATFEAGWLLARAVRLRGGWAMAAGLLVAWGGNPAGVRALWTLWHEARLGGYPFDLAGYDFWGPSRAIKNVVDEFPAFSAILGDFHAHHLALPWLVGWLAVLYFGFWILDFGLGNGQREQVEAGAGAHRAKAQSGTQRRKAEKGKAVGAEAREEQERSHTKAQRHEEERGEEAETRAEAPDKGVGSSHAKQSREQAFASTASSSTHPSSFAPLRPTSRLGAKSGSASASPFLIPNPKSKIQNPKSKILLFVWLFFSLGLAASLANLWNGLLLGLGCGVWIGVFVSRRRLWRWVGLPLLLSLLLGGLLVAGSRWQSGGHGAPLENTSNAQEFKWPGWPIQPVPAELRSTLFDWLMLWGWPVAALALGGLAWCWWGGRKDDARAEEATANANAEPVTPSPASLAPLLPLLLGCALPLLALELVYLQDRFRGELVRYNSYFKFSYPLWAPLCVLGVVALRRMTLTLWGPRRTPPGAVTLVRRVLAAALLAGFALAAGIYTPCAMVARARQAARGDAPPRRPTLAAFDFIGHRTPFAAELPLLHWLRRNTAPGTRVAEAGAHPPGGGAYQYGGRVASLAGRPVPLGWIHHEQQWRGPAAFTVLDERARAVDALYQAGSPEELRAAAAALGADFAVYGLVEAQQYGRGALERLRATVPVAARFDPPPLWQLTPELAASLPAIYLFDLRTPPAPVH